MKQAIVFWNGHGWIWAADTDHSTGDFVPKLALDEAIRSAHARGYNIAEVNRTAGAIRSRGVTSTLAESAAGDDPVNKIKP